MFAQEPHKKQKGQLRGWVDKFSFLPMFALELWGTDFLFVLLKCYSLERNNLLLLDVSLDQELSVPKLPGRVPLESKERGMKTFLFLTSISLTLQGVRYYPTPISLHENYRNNRNLMFSKDYDVLWSRL